MTVSACSSLPDGSASPSSTAIATPTAGADDFVATANGLRVDYSFDAVVQASSGVRVVNQAGLTFRSSVAAGHTTSVGETVGTYTVATDELAQLQAASRTSTVAKSRLWLLSQTTGAVRAVVAGVWVPSRAGGEVRIPGLEATAELMPLAALRIAGTRFEATASVETVFGPQTVGCVATWVIASSQGGQELHCRLPDGLETTAGLGASIRMRAVISATGVAIPFRYVGFDDRTQSYFVTEVQSGGPTRHLVVVGQTDGVLRFIVSGVAVGVRLRPVSAN